MTENERRLEFDKILAAAAKYCALEESRAAILALQPATALAEANRLLDFTEEATLLLFELGAGRIEAFAPLGDALERAEKGASLSCLELLNAASLLRSARVCYRSVQGLASDKIPAMKELSARLIFDEKLEEVVQNKILGEN